MKLTASSTRLLPLGTTTRSPPMNEAAELGAIPGSRAMPKSIFGFCWRARVMLKLPVPIMPTLPDPNCRWNVSPFSLRAPSGTLPALTMSRVNCRTCLTPSPTSGSSPGPAASILAPEAHISGPTVKMLHPAQLPGR
jgi:hypothetical protein